MATKLFDTSLMGGAQKALDFIGNVLEASTEYSVIGKDLAGKILLWNEGARRMYGYESAEVVGIANAEMLHTPEDIDHWNQIIVRIDRLAVGAGKRRYILQ